MFCNLQHKADSSGVVFWLIRENDASLEYTKLRIKSFFISYSPVDFTSLVIVIVHKIKCILWQILDIFQKNEVSTSIFTFWWYLKSSFAPLLSTTLFVSFHFIFYFFAIIYGSIRNRNEFLRGLLLINLMERFISHFNKCDEQDEMKVRSTQGMHAQNETKVHQWLFDNLMIRLIYLMDEFFIYYFLAVFFTCTRLALSFRHRADATSFIEGLRRVFIDCEWANKLFFNSKFKQ